MKRMRSLFSGWSGRGQRSSGQPLRHHLAVHDGDVDEEQQDDEEVVHEAQQPHHTLGDEVQRRGQVGQSAQHTQQDPDAEHPEETPDGEHLSEGVPQQRRDVPQTVQQLQRHTNTVSRELIHRPVQRTIKKIKNTHSAGHNHYNTSISSSYNWFQVSYFYILL